MDAKPLPDLTIRPADEHDMADVAAIYAHHVRFGLASFETEAPDLAEMLRRRSDVLSRGFPYLVATRNGIVQGYAYAGTYRPRAAYRDTVENSIYLRPDAAGQGIGRRLLAELIASCEQLDLRQMIAIIGDSANHASIRLHQRCGFRMVGVLEAVGYKHGRWLDSVLMQRRLGQGDASPPDRP
ncbi:MAG: N-acetyltransferase family protein [Acetobacteraceae bacterium]